MKIFIVALLAGFIGLMPGLAAALEVGDEAPLFEAVSDKGPVNLVEYRGQKNVVLAFYFKAFSPV
jgi:peroxiredoxin